MTTIVLQAEALNLPEVFAFKMRGKKVELTERGDTIVINPVMSAKVFGDLPDIFLKPIVIDNFHMYSRDELNER